MAILFTMGRLLPHDDLQGRCRQESCGWPGHVVMRLTPGTARAAGSAAPVLRCGVFPIALLEQAWAVPPGVEEARMTRGWKAARVGVMPCIIGALLATVPASRAAAEEPPALTIDNMHEKSVVHSGFVVGTASEASGAVRVQVSLDGGPFQDLSLIHIS